MKLEPEQESVLKGENGRIMAKAMETVVRYGEAFGAQKLVPIKSGHLAGTFGIGAYRAYVHILRQMVDEGLTGKSPYYRQPQAGVRHQFFKPAHRIPQAEDTGGTALRHRGYPQLFLRLLRKGQCALHGGPPCVGGIVRGPVRQLGAGRTHQQELDPHRCMLRHYRRNPRVRLPARRATGAPRCW